MGKEAETEVEQMKLQFKQQMIAAAFGSFDPAEAMKGVDKMFREKTPEEMALEEIVPENEEDVQTMLGRARRLGVIE